MTIPPPGPDVRWKQRLSNYSSALSLLRDADLLRKKRPLTQLEEQGLVKAFEFTYELAWNVLKDYFIFQGNASIFGPRDAFREAFQKGIIENGPLWMEMIQDRNLSSHTYNKKIAGDIAEEVATKFLPQFEQLLVKLTELSKRS